MSLLERNTETDAKETNQTLTWNSREQSEMFALNGTQFLVFEAVAVLMFSACSLVQSVVVSLWGKLVLQIHDGTQSWTRFNWDD